MPPLRENLDTLYQNFEYLDGKSITYIVSIRESKKLRGIKEATLNDPKDRVQIYGMKDGYVKGKGYQALKFKVAFNRKKNINFGRLRAQYINGTWD